MRKLSNIMPFFVCAVLLVLFLYLGLLGMAYMFPVESDGGCPDWKEMDFLWQPPAIS